jgi:hypothetical protein
MRPLLLAAVCGLLAGCSENNSSPTSKTFDSRRADDRINAGKDKDVPVPVDSDNTAVNQRDRNDATITPLDQSENKQDLTITAEIRRQVVDSKLSLNAHNVKIITQGGNVTLRGPVKNEEEKKRIEEIASGVAGVEQVDNELEVQ